MRDMALVSFEILDQTGFQVFQTLGTHIYSIKLLVESRYSKEAELTKYHSKLRHNRNRMKTECTHLGEIQLTGTKTHVCEECSKSGDRWVHLRLCLTCGHVGCCDSSKNKHATKHFHATKHPLVRSIEPGEGWIWCYVDEVMPAEVGPGGAIRQ